MRGGEKKREEEANVLKTCWVCASGSIHPLLGMGVEKRRIEGEKKKRDCKQKEKEWVVDMCQRSDCELVCCVISLYPVHRPRFSLFSSVCTLATKRDPLFQVFFYFSCYLPRSRCHQSTSQWGTRIWSQSLKK